MSEKSSRWDWRDLYNLPTLISLTRIPLTAAFVLLREHSAAELSVLAAAGLSDILDGWIARKTGKTSAVGAFVDGLVDKLFVFGVALALLSTERVLWWEMLLLGIRDLGEGLLILWTALRAPAMFREQKPHAVLFGKVTTLLQFTAVVAAILGVGVWPFAVSAAVLGMITTRAYGKELQATARRITGEASLLAYSWLKFAREAP